MTSPAFHALRVPICQPCPKQPPGSVECVRGGGGGGWGEEWEEGGKLEGDCTSTPTLTYPAFWFIFVGAFSERKIKRLKEAILLGFSYLPIPPLENSGGALTNGRICPLDRLIYMSNWLSHLHSHKYLFIFIRDMFEKKTLSHIFFKVRVSQKSCTSRFHQ